MKYLKLNLTKKQKIKMMTRIFIKNKTIKLNNKYIKQILGNC